VKKRIETPTVVAIIVIIAIAAIGGFFVFQSLRVSPLTPARFEVSNLAFEPSDAEVDEPVRILATIKNTGDLGGNFTVTLKINGVAEATEEVTLTGGSTKTVSFTVTKSTIGTYAVEVDGLRCTFSVLRHILKVGKTGYSYLTIQEALNNAQYGDGVRVMDGATYEESLTIPIDNITLDLKGATVKGTYVEGHGILLHGRSYVTIKNGVVKNFASFVIDMIYSSHITVENMRMQNNTGIGIFLYNSSYNTITNNVVTDDKDGGILLLSASSHNIISNNDLSRNNGGIGLGDGSSYNIVENNLVSNSKYERGISIEGFCNHNRIVNNNASSSNWDGISLGDHSDNNTVENNIANSNRLFGIRIMSEASYNVIQNNTALYNAIGQIIEDENWGNILSNNTIAGPQGRQSPRLIDRSQNDAGMGRDAASMDAEADEIALGDYTGYLNDTDIFDCYKIFLNSDQTIKIEMTPPAGADYDLLLEDQNLGWIERSFKTGSSAESISFTVTSSGYYIIVIRQWRGAGTYAFSLTT